jgi:hypothetical protein
MPDKQLTKNDVAEIISQAFDKRDAWIKVEFSRVRSENDRLTELVNKSYKHLEDKLTKQIRQLSSDVADSFDLLSLDIDERFNNHEKRLVRLEAPSS